MWRLKNAPPLWATYAIGMNMLEQGEIREGPAKELVDQISDTLKEAPETCFICEAACERGD